MPATAVLLFLGLGAAALLSRKPSGSAAASAPFSNGMPADANLPADTRAAVEAFLTQQPDPPGPGGYQILVNAGTQTAVFLRQNYPKASDAVWARYNELRAIALAQGWRTPDAIDAGQR